MTYGLCAFPRLAGLKARRPSADTAPGSTLVVAVDARLMCVLFLPPVEIACSAKHAIVVAEVQLLIEPGNCLVSGIRAAPSPL